MITTLKSGEVSRAEFDQRDVLCRGARQWRRAQYLAEQFWTRFRTEYLLDLQKRRKWTVERKNLKPGDLVLIREKSCKRYNWPTGIVESVNPSRDGLVRRAILRTVKPHRGAAVTFVERPVTELVFLEGAPGTS